MCFSPESELNYTVSGDAPLKICGKLPSGEWSLVFLLFDIVTMDAYAYECMCVIIMVLIIVVI